MTLSSSPTASNPTMPWNPRDTMKLRQEFVELALHQSAPFTDLCRRFGVSRQTGYKWLNRYKEDGIAGLADQSPPAVALAIDHPARARRAHAQPRLGRARSPGSCAIRRRCRRRPPARLPGFCIATTGLRREHRPIPPPGSASSASSPTSCGRWISRAAFLPWAKAGAIR